MSSTLNEEKFECGKQWEKTILKKSTTFNIALKRLLKAYTIMFFNFFLFSIMLTEFCPNTNGVQALCPSLSVKRYPTLDLLTSVIS